MSFFLLLNYTSMHALRGREIKREKGIQGVDFPTVKSANWCAAAKPKTSVCESSAPALAAKLGIRHRQFQAASPSSSAAPSAEFRRWDWTS